MSYGVLREYLQYLTYPDIVAFASTSSKLTKVINQLEPAFWRNKAVNEFGELLTPGVENNYTRNWRRIYQYLCEIHPLTAMAQTRNLGFLAEYTAVYNYEYVPEDFEEAVNFLFIEPNSTGFTKLLRIAKAQNLANAYELTAACLEASNITYAFITAQVMGSKSYTEAQLIYLVEKAFRNDSSQVDELLEIIRILGPEHRDGWFLMFLRCSEADYLLAKAQRMVDLGYVNPSSSKSLLFRSAVDKGAIGLVQLLIDVGRSKPAEAKNYAVRRAASQGYVEIMRLLIDTGQVDIHTQNDLPINLAVMNAQVAMVKFLLVNGVRRNKVTTQSLDYCERQRTNSPESCKEIRKLVGK